MPPHRDCPRSAGKDTSGSAEGLEQFLRDAVRLRMASDVPVGAFLSGGIDSSLVVALMQSQTSEPVKTFTIGFPATGSDEAEHAAAVARHLGTQHTQLCNARRRISLIPALPEIYDEPFADASQIPTVLITRLAKRQVTVALSGDGRGDELFGGYNRYLWCPAVLHNSKRLPRPLRHAASHLLQRVPVAFSNAGFRGSFAPPCRSVFPSKDR